MLVSAFSSASAGLIEALVDSGLDLLTVSVHAAEAASYDDIYRFCSLKNYPHLILYRYANDVATVVAVYHPSREPGYWRNR